MKRILLLLSATAAALVIGPVPVALAGSNGALATTDGSSSQWFHDGDYFKTCDTDSDGDWRYTKYTYSGGYGQFNNKNGHGSCATGKINLPEGTNFTYKSCQDDAFADTCSDWKSGRA